MSESELTMEIDARGLPCPQPVVLAKKAFEAGGFSVLKVTVDNKAAEENLLKLAGFVKAPCLGRSMNKNECTLSFGPAASPSAGPGGAAGLASAVCTPASADGAEAASNSCGGPEPELTIFIPHNRIGDGDEELGQKLVQGFLYTLAEAEQKPARIVFMNSGVRLLVRDSKALESVKRLEAAGVDIIACGTCLDFYGLKAELGAGRISNMYDIATLLCAGRTLTV